MNIDKSRRGSALLIVIGMLSFMVVSAVSFSIYMRQSRAPSSYLRRASSSRYLLKAALAHAIDRLDGAFASYAEIGSSELGSNPDSGLVEGVYDDPYPGVGPSLSQDSSNNHSRNGDFWDHRIFTPFGGVSPARTVSTLTLEGLAYLPPALINEARVFSRQTRTAMWRNLSYDMGRYAFSAIDVSDCFDINRLRAGMRRTSAPNGRVNLSSLYDGATGASLDNVLKLWENDEIPFVSVADFNIAAGQSQFSPFCKYIGTSGSDIYSRGEAQSISNALFITDTWFPSTNTTSSQIYDLASDQPFKQFKDNMSIRELITGPTPLGNMLIKNIGAGMACLYDYLDEDSLPISFCMPTVEVAPMICGMGFMHQGQFTPRVTRVDGEAVTGTYVDSATQKTVTWTATPYKLTSLGGNVLLKGVAAFPFKRLGARDGYQTQFTGKALVRIFMAPATMRCRVPESSAIAPRKNDWNNQSASVVDGVVSVAYDLSGLSFGEVKTQDDAVKDVMAMVNLSGANVSIPIYWIVEQTVPDSQVGQVQFAEPYTSFDGCLNGLSPYDENGNRAAWWTQTANANPVTGTSLPKRPQNMPPATEYVPHVAVWMQLKNGGDVIDIAPARLNDDADWGNRTVNDLFNFANRLGGADVPVLEFRCNKPFTYANGNIADVLNGSAQTFEWAELYAPDPRYNYAPEDWCAVSGDGSATPQKWLEKIGAKNGDGILGHDERDKDIFMFVSDQEYMQSIGELAFLPTLGALDGNQGFFSNCDYFDAISAAFNGVDIAKGAGRRIFGDGEKLAVSGLASGNYMWRTYSTYYGDPIYDLRDGGTPVEVVNGTSDFRVNPFSTDTRVLMAALKDSPFDYYVASTNQNLNHTANDKPSNASKYAFTENSTYAPMSADELQDLADAMRGSFVDGARDGRAWESAFNNLMWYKSGEMGDNQLTLFGVELDNPLHGVDRKFLYSFWRECFQNRQQLFLVFIRAEPPTVGGADASGSIATSQLGARGVALVWRDPAPPKRGSRPERTALTTRENWRQYYQTCSPHRTRVLFYHQFD